MMAVSVTERVSGPASSCVKDTGTMPSRLTSPSVERIDTRLSAEAGEGSELAVSEPVPTVAKLAASATAVPPLEPPGVNLRLYGFLVCPPSELTVTPPSANSCRLVLPRIRAPFFLSRLTTKASCDGCAPANEAEPPVVG